MADIKVTRSWNVRFKIEDEFRGELIRIFRKANKECWTHHDILMEANLRVFDTDNMKRLPRYMRESIRGMFKGMLEMQWGFMCEPVRRYKGDIVPSSRDDSIEDWSLVERGYHGYKADPSKVYFE